MNETLKHISFAYTGQWVENSIPFSWPHAMKACLTMSLLCLNSCEDKMIFICTPPRHFTITCQLISSVAQHSKTIRIHLEETSKCSNFSCGLILLNLASFHLSIFQMSWECYSTFSFQWMKLWMFFSPFSGRRIWGGRTLCVRDRNVGCKGKVSWLVLRNCCLHLHTV
jgi:hypothetical protein